MGNTCNNIIFKEDFMRREKRRNVSLEDNMNQKIIKYAGIGVAILAVIVFALLMYSRSLNEEVKKGSLSSEQIASIMNNNSSSNTQSSNTQSASTEMGKTVNEAANSMNVTTNTTGDNTTKQNTTKTTNTTTQNNTKTNTTNSTKATNTENEKKEEKKELSFTKPVEGEIVRDFAKDNLIYSETLQEWTTHTGIDIKAEKTTVVKCAEAGTVKSIKNDPRYGLTVVVDHGDGFQTVYSNLLTSEFVVEGEKLEKGQSLGTVGSTAVFEISDEPHLHFEILKDSIQVDPNLYLK